MGKVKRYKGLMLTQVKLLYRLIDDEIKTLPKYASYPEGEERENAGRYYMKMRFVRDWLNHKIHKFYKDEDGN